MKTIFMVWQLKLCGTAEELAGTCRDYNIAGVTIKVLNSYNKFNAKEGDGPLIDYISVLRNRGLIVEGWGYHYPGSAERQGEAIAERYETLALDAYQVNVEAQYKAAGEFKSGAAFKAMMDQLSPGFNITVCTYRFPTVHPEMPWEKMSEHPAVNGWTPQVYWALSDNPVEQLQQCFDEYNAIDNKPVYPVGPTFGQNFKVGKDKVVYWTPKEQELIDFREACSGLSRIYYFRLDQVIQKGWWDMLAAATGTKAVKPDPDPEPHPDPDPEPEPNHPKLLQFKTLYDGQNIRSEPSTGKGSRTVTEKASTGQIFEPLLEVRIINSQEVWFKFEEGWLAAVYGRRQYLTEI